VSHHVIGGVCEGARVACCSGGCHIYIHTHTHTRTNECVRGCRKRESWWGSYHVLLLMGRLCSNLNASSFNCRLSTKCPPRPTGDRCGSVPRRSTPRNSCAQDRFEQVGQLTRPPAAAAGRHSPTHSLGVHSTPCGVKIITSRCWLSATQSHRMHNNAA
jgi:hypothetical protein